MCIIFGRYKVVITLLSSDIVASTSQEVKVGETVSLTCVIRYYKYCCKLSHKLPFGT